MKVFEIFSQNIEDKKIDFDLADDVIYFMNNDPEFYRKEYFPFLTKFQHHCDAGRQVTPKAFFPVVKRAVENYKLKFPMNELEEALNDGQITEICEKLQTQELANYHNQKEK
jgi:hypothetical protein